MIVAIGENVAALSTDEAKANYKSNFASAERTFIDKGVGGHPGDKGMKGIADAILKAVKK